MTPKIWEDAYVYYYGYIDAKTGKTGNSNHSLQNKATKMKRFRITHRTF